MNLENPGRLGGRYLLEICPVNFHNELSLLIELSARFHRLSPGSEDLVGR